ncbi:HigA family addiction module antitoxin, partial [Klebsiella pneumoniae]
ANSKKPGGCMFILQKPMHPGEFIREVYLEPLEIQISTFAEKIGVDTSTISRLVNQKADLSYEMAIRLSKAFGRSAESWMKMQIAYGLYRAQDKVNLDEVETIYTPRNLDAAEMQDHEPYINL